MKRYRIYLAVILFVFAGAHQRVFSQNSAIDTILLQIPTQTTVYDPLLKDLRVQIKMKSLITWGNTDHEGISYFSLTNNHSWEPTLVEYSGNGVEPFYVCKYNVNDYFVEDTNVIFFWIHDTENSIDIVKRFTIIYDKPQVELLSVAGSDSIPSTRHYVVYESNPQFSARAKSLFTSLLENSLITRLS
jgi:hypothetical protein